MKKLIACMLVLSACGTWSNEDLEYLYAIPRKEALRSQLGSTGNTTQQPLSVGDPSQTYDKTKGESDQFNTFIDGILTALDFIRSIPPTTRKSDSRIWGPYPDEQNQGFDVRVVISRSDKMNYTWSIDMKKRGTEDYFTIGGGDFKATQTLRKGRGHMFFDAATANARLMKEMKASDPARVDIGYSTDTDPIIVEMDLAFDGGVTLGYAYNGNSDKSAVLQYVATNPADTNIRKASYVAGWTSNTAGRADFVVLEGAYVGGTGTECWDEGHTVVYAQGYDGGARVEIGDKTKCAEPPELKPLPSP